MARDIWVRESREDKGPEISPVLFTFGMPGRRARLKGLLTYPKLGIEPALAFWLGVGRKEREEEVGRKERERRKWGGKRGGSKDREESGRREYEVRGEI